MTPKVATSDTGSVTLGITVAHSLRRKMKMTSTTSATVSTSVNCTSWIAARIVVVRSLTTEIFSAAGSESWSFGKMPLIASTTSIVFAPGWRWMSSSTARSPWNHAACSASSTPSMAVPTSRSSTGAPLR